MSIGPATGLAEALAFLTRLERLDGLEDAVNDAARAVLLPDAQVYPPERPGQRYIRTGTLRRGWRALPAGRTAGMVRGGVANSTSYAPDVQGTGTQRAIFQGRWRTAKAIGDANAPAVRAIVLRAIYAMRKP